MNIFLLFIVIVVVSFFVVSCSGSSGKQNDEIKRDIIYYGYYGDMSFQFDETKDHVNTIWIAAWDKQSRSWIEVVFDRVKQASENGKKSVIMMTNQTYLDKKFNPKSVEELGELFEKLQKIGYLKDVVAVYPVDEPDYQEIPSEEIQKTNQTIREVMSKYPDSKDIALAVFYTGKELYPGIEYYDWVGFDEYNAGTGALGAKYRRMLNRLREDQRTMIIPGGCDKWRQDPKPFVNFALENPRVVAVVPFIWIDNADPGNDDVGLGIRSNGMAELYRQSGLTLINK